MAYSDSPHRYDAHLQESSPPHFKLQHSFSQPNTTEPQEFTLLLALIGKITILGFALAWGLALLQAIQ